MRRVLLSGTSGFVGRHLVPHLRSRGIAVVRLSRGGAPAIGEGEVLAAPADLADLGNGPALADGFDAVIHLAALNPVRGSRAGADEAALMRANAGGTAALAALAARAGVERFVFLSSARVHGAGADGPVTEAAPLRPGDPYARSKAAAEAALADVLKGSATRGIVLRPPPVYGVGGGGLVGGLARLAATPLPLPLDGLGAPRSLIAVSSLVEAIAACLDLPPPSDGPGSVEALLPADRQPLTPAAVVAAIRRGLGRPVRLLAAPPGVGHLARQLTGGSGGPLSGFAVDPARAAARLGPFGWRPVASSEAMLERLAGDGAFGPSRRG